MPTCSAPHQAAADGAQRACRPPLWACMSLRSLYAQLPHTLSVVMPVMPHAANMAGMGACQVTKGRT